MGITFGERVTLESLGLNEQSSFDESDYGRWRTLTDLSGDALDLLTIDTSDGGDNRRMSGSRILGVHGGERWWHAYIPSDDDTPDNVRMVIRGASDTDSRFVVGETWGFKIYVKRATENTWKYVLGSAGRISSTDLISEDGSSRIPIVETNLTIPLTSKPEMWRAYFHPYNEDNFDVKIEAARINRAPTANAGSDRTVSPGARVTLQGSGTDPESGDTLTYSWEQPAGRRVTLSSTSEARPTFTAPSRATTLTFRLRVTDNHGASDTDTVTIRVRSPESWGS